MFVYTLSKAGLEHQGCISYFFHCFDQIPSKKRQMFYFGSWIESLVHHSGVSTVMGVASSEWTRTDVFPRLTLLFNGS